MNYKIIHSVPADLDLDGIIHYIIFRLKNSTAARDLLEEYEKKLAGLRQNPRLYGLSQIERLARLGYRRFAFGNYIAFYTIDEENRQVYIVRIFYQKQDYEKVFD